jgi:hypothetical protein
LGGGCSPSEGVMRPGVMEGETGLEGMGVSFVKKDWAL